MTAPSATPARMGIALDGTLLTAVWSRSSAAQSAGHRSDSDAWGSLIVPCDGTRPSVSAALGEVAAVVSGAVEVAFTLLRPLAATRTLAFPRMKRAELESVLERDWARYAIGLRSEPHLAAARELGSGSWRAAFAPVTTADALVASAREHGWTVRDLRTTDDALAAAALQALPTVARMDDVVVVLCGTSGATEVTRLHRGAPVSGRQLLAGSAAEVASFARHATQRATSPATVLIVGDDERGNALARELGQQGFRAQFSPLAPAANDSPAAFLATSALLRPARLPLVTHQERDARLRRSRLATWALGAAALLLVAAGLGIESRRLDRELATVNAERAAIAPRVSDAVARRATLESATEAATALAEHEARASRASAAVAAIVLALPENAALSVLQVSGDSVHIEGESDRSADVYTALRSAKSLEGVRLAGALRQERQADGTSMERFAFVARVRGAQR